MEGLVLSATAFMSFASILWLVVAKLATGNEDEASETASANNDEDEAPHTLTSVTSKLPASFFLTVKIGYFGWCQFDVKCFFFFKTANF